ncbi:hypothetical protein GCM10007907_39470 [Chitinimonas prasina]|uniref:Uncharacterized protein n=1 Tax=Chitinimonas prasina TaxID=1434937 RepID=A0ABQ5YKV8_9NEIS|nr:hypothetical protein [Chitinimonas prasina]GLR15157.1 hypothetical protein GCM10007907_39470 [Chitinimonas prasina]
MTHPPASLPLLLGKAWHGWLLAVPASLAVWAQADWRWALAAFVVLGFYFLLDGLAVCYLSLFGSRAAIISSLHALLFMLPLSFCLATLALGQAQAGLIWLTLLAAYLIVLGCMVVLEWRKAPWPSPDAKTLAWPGTQIKLDSRQLQASTTAAQRSKASWLIAPAASVPLYHLLRPWLEQGSGLHWLALLGNLLLLWMAATLGRPLAQGCKLRLLELRNLANSPPFTSNRLAELEQLRQQTAPGRWLRARFPLPTGVSAQAKPGKRT